MLTYDRSAEPFLRSIDPAGELDSAHTAIVELLAATAQRCEPTVGAIVSRARYRAADERRRCERQTAGYFAARTYKRDVIAPEEAVLQAECRVLVRAAIQRLPLRFRALVQLRFFEEAPVAELSTRLGIPAKRVYQDLQRARAMLAADPLLADFALN